MMKLWRRKGIGDNMKIVKKPAPQFYDCVCPKCKAEFIYQLDDVAELEKELPEGMNEIIASMMPTVLSYVTCPCCEEKITVGGGFMNMGLTGGRM